MTVGIKEESIFDNLLIWDPCAGGVFCLVHNIREYNNYFDDVSFNITLGFTDSDLSYISVNISRVQIINDLEFSDVSSTRGNIILGKESGFLVVNPSMRFESFYCIESEMIFIINCENRMFDLVVNISDDFDFLFYENMLCGFIIRDAVNKFYYYGKKIKFKSGFEMLKYAEYLSILSGCGNDRDMKNLYFSLKNVDECESITFLMSIINEEWCFE